jgi:hypothetical protein
MRVYVNCNSFGKAHHIDIEQINILVLEIVRVGQFNPSNCKMAISY